VKSSGPAAYEQELYMGEYLRLNEDHNNHPAYVKNTSQPLFIYYFTHDNAEKNQWVIGPSRGQLIAGIRNKGVGSCVDRLSDGWIYAANDNSWRNNDHTLTIECMDPHDATIKTLVNLELNKTMLTIGIKSDRKSISTGIAHDMKHKEMDINKDMEKSHFDQRSNKLKSEKASKKFNPTSDVNKLVEPINGTLGSANITVTSKVKNETDSMLTKCYSCGSLFSSDTSDCKSFDENDKSQKVTCKYGDACLLYAWKISKTEICK